LKHLFSLSLNTWTTRSYWMLALCAITLSQPENGFASDPSFPHELVSRALVDLGAGRDVKAISSITVEGKEITQDLVESDHPLAPPFYTRSTNSIRRSYDFERQVQSSEVTDGPGHSISLLSHDFSAVVDRKEPAATRQVGAAPPSWTVRDPIAALRLAAHSNDLTLQPDIVWHGALQHVVSFHDGRYPVRIFLNAATGLPDAVESVVTYDDQHMAEAIAWNALGDVVERTEYQNWSFVDGIRYPLQQDRLRNGQLIWTLAIASARLNDPVDAHELALLAPPPFQPASVQDLSPAQRVPGGPYPDKPIAEIAPGVVQIPNSWYSVIVRQADGLVIIDAPISSGYSKGVLEEAAKRFPGIPVKALVTSTGFFWHVAGVREYAARGIPIYAEARNVPVLLQMLAAPHTLAPDDLSQEMRAPSQVIPITDRTVIGGGPNAIQVYPITRATQPMLMTYIQDAHLLHTGEMVQPLGPGGSILFPESLIELTETVEADHLPVETIIGMHMSPTPWSAVGESLRAAGATASRTPKP
jgi:hypothetical protein